MPASGFNRTFIYMTAALIVWGVRFLAVYSLTAVACSRGWSTVTIAGIGLIPAVTGILSAAALLFCFGLFAWSVARIRDAGPQAFASVRAEQAGRVEATRENTSFVHYIAATISLFAAVGIAWETLPVFIVPLCT